MRRVNIYHWYKGALTRRGFSQVPSDPASRVQQSYTKIRDVAFEKVSSIKGVVDDIVGITEVQKAQISVREAENEFMNTRKKVGELKKDLDSLHTQLAKLRSRLDRTPRHDEKYLALATDEHNILREEKRLKSVYDQAESLERDQFVQLSASVRDSHERERARAERTKYWSVMGSLGGAFLGILGSTVMNYVRLKEIKNSVKGTKESLMEKTETVKDSIESQGELLQARLAEMRDIVNAYLETNVNTALVSMLNQPESGKMNAQKMSKSDIDMAGSFSQLHAELMMNSDLVRNNHSGIQKSISEVQEGLLKIQDLLHLQRGELQGQLSQRGNTENSGEIPTQDELPPPRTRPVTSIRTAQEDEKQAFEETKWWIKANFISTLVSLGVFIYLECFK